MQNKYLEDTAFLGIFEQMNQLDHIQLHTLETSVCGLTPIFSHIVTNPEEREERILF